MRVSIKALAPLPLLLCFASCVTPPPMPGPGRSVAYGSGRGYQERDRSQRDRPYGESRYDSERSTEARTYRDRPSNDRLSDSRRYDDGRYNLRRPGDGRPTPMSAAYEPATYEPGVTATGQRRRGPGNYDDGYADPVPPHERGDYSGRPRGRISFTFGRRDLIDDSIRASNELYAFGVNFAQAVEPGTLGFEFGFHFAGDREDRANLPASGTFPGGIFDVERDMAEVSAGVRAEFSRSNVRPYIGGGGTLINMSETRSQGFNKGEDDDTTLGVYLHGGVQFDVNDSFFLGLDFRRVFGSQANLFDQSFDTDYGQLSFVLGLSL